MTLQPENLPRIAHSVRRAAARGRHGGLRAISNVGARDSDNLDNSLAVFREG